MRYTIKAVKEVDPRWQPFTPELRTKFIQVLDPIVFSKELTKSYVQIYIQLEFGEGIVGMPLEEFTSLVSSKYPYFNDPKALFRVTEVPDTLGVIVEAESERGAILAYDDFKAVTSFSKVSVQFLCWKWQILSSTWK